MWQDQTEKIDAGGRLIHATCSTGPRPKNRKERKMEPTNSFTEEEQSGRLERVFQIFARTQEDWAMAHDSDKSTVDMEKDAEVWA